MNEASKTHRLRSKFFREPFLSGKVLDIGSGPMPFRVPNLST